MHLRRGIGDSWRRKTGSLDPQRCQLLSPWLQLTLYGLQEFRFPFRLITCSERLSVCAEEPEGELKEAIDRDFGSLDEFKKQFKAAGATQFGSGWAWLTKGKDGKLKVKIMAFVLMLRRRTPSMRALGAPGAGPGFPSKRKVMSRLTCLRCDRGILCMKALTVLSRFQCPAVQALRQGSHLLRGFLWGWKMD